MVVRILGHVVRSPRKRQMTMVLRAVILHLAPPLLLMVGPERTGRQCVSTRTTDDPATGFVINLAGTEDFFSYGSPVPNVNQPPDRASVANLPRLLLKVEDAVVRLKELSLNRHAKRTRVGKLSGLSVVP